MKLGKYQHSKTGKLYNIIGIAKHSETLEDLVVYQPLYKSTLSQLWVRPKKMFLEEIELNGKKFPRFTIIDK